VRIEHVALWTGDLARLERFYCCYFGAKAGPRYVNAAKGFESCFLSFTDGARLEIMTTVSLSLSARHSATQTLGLAHFAVAVGSAQQVDELARRMRDEGITILDGPRRTGDGYYEAVTLDPDGNRVEICSTGDKN